jgi:hypothetical protein
VRNLTSPLGPQWTAVERDRRQPISATGEIDEPIFPIRPLTRA